VLTPHLRFRTRTSVDAVKASSAGALPRLGRRSSEGVLIELVQAPAELVSAMDRLR
jgi:hypothetical protein